MTKVLICYGQGGHKEQAVRIARELSTDYELYSLTDKGSILEQSREHIEIGELRNKKNGRIEFNNLMNFWLVFKFIKNNNIEKVISLGPGCCVICMVIAWALGLKTLHIESWSKFESLTFTGQVAKLLKIKILIQNRSLQAKYPNLEYIGRL